MASRDTPEEETTREETTEETSREEDTTREEETVTREEVVETYDLEIFSYGNTPKPLQKDQPINLMVTIQNNEDEINEDFQIEFHICKPGTAGDCVFVASLEETHMNSGEQRTYEITVDIPEDNIVYNPSVGKDQILIKFYVDGDGQIEETNEGNNLAQMAPTFADEAEEVAEEVCTDDNEKDYYTKDYVSGLSSVSDQFMNFVDACSEEEGPYSTSTNYALSGLFVHEWFCGEDEYVTAEFYECPNGCYDGACVEEAVEGGVLPELIIAEDFGIFEYQEFEVLDFFQNDFSGTEDIGERGYYDNGFVVAIQKNEEPISNSDVIDAIDDFKLLDCTEMNDNIVCLSFIEEYFVNLWVSNEYFFYTYLGEFENPEEAGQFVDSENDVFNFYQAYLDKYPSTIDDDLADAMEIGVEEVYNDYGINLVAILGEGDVIIEEEIEEIEEEEEETEEVEEEEEVEPIELVNGVCNGCEADNNCYPYGTRIEGSFCGLNNEWDEQKPLEEDCDNNYECSSNQCINGVCDDVVGKLEEAESLIQQLINYIKDLFGIDFEEEEEAVEEHPYIIEEDFGPIEFLEIGSEDEVKALDGKDGMTYFGGYSYNVLVAVEVYENEPTLEEFMPFFEDIEKEDGFDVESVGDDTYIYCIEQYEENNAACIWVSNDLLVRVIVVEEYQAIELDNEVEESFIDLIEAYTEKHPSTITEPIQELEEVEAIEEVVEEICYDPDGGLTGDSLMLKSIVTSQIDDSGTDQCWPALGENAVKEFHCLSNDHVGYQFQYCPDGMVCSGGACCEIGAYCEEILICGNGVLEDGEECDDGNDISSDGCTNECTISFCGNGVLDEGEECDDGNNVFTDGCTTACTTFTCSGDCPEELLNDPRIVAAIEANPLTTYNNYQEVLLEKFNDLKDNDIDDWDEYRGKYYLDYTFEEELEMYLQKVAFMLFHEYQGTFPWSITDYSDEDIILLIGDLFIGQSYLAQEMYPYFNADFHYAFDYVNEAIELYPQFEINTHKDLLDLIIYRMHEDGWWHIDDGSYEEYIANNPDFYSENPADLPVMLYIHAGGDGTMGMTISALLQAYNIPSEGIASYLEGAHQGIYYPTLGLSMNGNAVFDPLQAGFYYKQIPNKLPVDLTYDDYENEYLVWLETEEDFCDRQYLWVRKRALNYFNHYNHTTGKLDVLFAYCDWNLLDYIYTQFISSSCQNTDPNLETYQPNALTEDEEAEWDVIFNASIQCSPKPPQILI